MLKTEMDREKRAYWRKWRIWASVFAAWLLMMAMLKWPEVVSGAAQRAMEQWYHGVAPALFPFMMLMPLITSREAMQVYEKILGRFMQALFGLPGAAAPAMVIGMVAGSPAGVIAAGRVAENIGLERRQLLRVTACVCGLSPAFLISGIGAGLMQSIEAGEKLFITQVATQLIMMTATRWMRGGGKIAWDPVEAENTGVKSAVLTVMTVAGYMVFFNALAAIVSEILDQKAGGYLICLLEISAGACQIIESELEQTIKMVILAGMCGFGGVCICAQNMKNLSKYGISAAEYIPYRLLSGGISAGIMIIWEQWDIDFLNKIQIDSMVFLTLVAIILAIPALIGVKKSIS